MQGLELLAMLMVTMVIGFWIIDKIVKKEGD